MFDWDKVMGIAGCVVRSIRYWELSYISITATSRCVKLISLTGQELS